MSTGAFRRVFAAEVISTFGSLMSRLAIPWLAVLVLDQSHRTTATRGGNRGDINAA
jgi:hypothetical protein